ncbi:hypothetical protein QBC38DRAFT_491957 [Podospora fimiseda]|uniref:MARVEL domain-containing protein n=1 Tax=Podospora fimiseda TaxID=252190 RepID=A0AAN7BF19_9PEZI|nr:hypothetical protein QBC38DRAFT_491957 [Podospora fimiseda]
MAHGNNRARTGLSKFLLASSAVVWVSSVIVMGILAYLVSEGWRGDHIIYTLVISVLTTVFYLAAFFLAAYPGYVLLFNLIFSYLWIVAVSFLASDWTYSNSPLLNAAEAFAFIAFFFLLFNVLYDWHNGFYRHGRSTSVV